MIGFNFRGLGRFLRRSFFEHRGKNYRLTAKRLGVLLLSLAVYIPVEIMVWIGLGLDRLFYPGFKQVRVRAPIFIIGNPRSGTTFLHRLLSRDEGHFASMTTWEILLAPAVSTRRFIRAAAGLIRLLGVPIRRLIRQWERDWQENNTVHKIRLRGPEEDEYLWVHTFSTLKIWSFAAMLEEAEPYVYYDQRMDPAQKTRMMDFYHRCLQRHLFSGSTEDEIYLAKNPNFSPMVRTLLERYPDARFIYLVRDPLQAVPSHLSLKEKEWKLLGSPLEPYAAREFILEESEHWYTYPLAELDKLPDHQAVILEFEKLTGNARAAVREIYQRFDLELSEDFDRVLREETRKARQHESEHVYCLEEMGLTASQLKDRFGAVYRRFDFQRGAAGEK